MASSARPAASQRAYQREDMSLRMRRPPEEYVTLLSQTEQEFRAYVHDFENNPLFSRLISEGAIARVRLRGRIPREKYEEFMDEELVAFLRDNGITEREGWERDFLAPHALDRISELSKKYEVAPGPLIRNLRYLRSSSQSPSEWTQAAGQARPAADSSPSADELAIERMSGETPASMVDLTEIIETTREFVARYEVSEQEFLDLILGGEATPEELAARFECSLREAEDVLEAADRVYLLESYNAPPAGTRPATRPGSISTGSGQEMAVAWVEIIDDRASIQFAHDSVYAQRYHIRASTLKAALAKKEAAAQDAAATPESLADARELMARARLINQRLSSLSRLITTLCNRQVDYLKSGDARLLKPLAQADLAREMGEHPSTISRLIRRKIIETPWGKIPLLYLCQSKTDVVARLIGEFPKLTDQQVVSKLRDEFDCSIARRTVAYHRGKRLRRNKRQAEKDDKTATAPDTQSAPAKTTKAKAVRAKSQSQP